MREKLNGKSVWVAISPILLTAFSKLLMVAILLEAARDQATAMCLEIEGWSIIGWLNSMFQVLFNGRNVWAEVLPN